MFDTIAVNFTSRTVNIGMDEAHMLGRGRYMDIKGIKNSFGILLDHLRKVAEIAEKRVFELIMWGDMFFRLLNVSKGGSYYDEVTVPDEIKEMIPKNVNLIYWDYYSEDIDMYRYQIKAHSEIKSSIWFAGGLWSWTGFTPHNQYSINATAMAFSACFEGGMQDVILTLWGDDGGECSKFALLPSL